MQGRHSKYIFKYLVRFFLGLSGVFFVTTAFNIAPIAPNAIQYIKTIFLTRDGSNTSATGIILEGLSGDGRFKASVTIQELANAPLIRTNASGMLMPANSGYVYNLISGFLSNGLTGATGAQGIQGNTGATGVTGATGATGLQGIQGIAGTNGLQGIQGDTGATGAIPAHEWSGTTWLRFQLPNGAREPSFINLLGPIGNTGAMGASGYAVVINIVQTGSAGTNGQCAGTGNIIGFYADKDYNLGYTPITDTLLGSTIMCSDGATGPQGIQGIQGNTGATGATGPQGIQGIQGNTGATGATGSQGIQGIQGTAGTNGTNGATGPQGIQGIQGNTGATGSIGPIGSTGPQGIQGIQGNTGATGSIGPMGVIGPIGSTGPQGNTGATGFLQAGILGATPFWNGASRTTLNTNIFNTGGYVGIGGVPSPKAQLQVFGNFIAGNLMNDIGMTSFWSSILGGTSNFITTTGYGNTIVGGENNIMQYGSTGYTGTNIFSSTILGGYGNKIIGVLDPVYKDIYTGAIYSSFAAGSGAQVAHTNTFVRNSSTGTFTSGRPYSFLINAPYGSVDKSPSFGGVGINTRFPTAALDVNGDIKGSGNLNISLNVTANTLNVGLSTTTQTMKLLTNLITGGAACPEAGVITYNGNSFYGCTSGYIRKQLDN